MSVRTPSSSEPEPTADSPSTSGEGAVDASPHAGAHAHADVHTESAPASDPQPKYENRNGEAAAPPSDDVQAEPGRNGVGPEGLSLEQRVSRLEDVIANLQLAHPELLAPRPDGRGAGAFGEFAASANQITEPPLPPPARPSLLFEVYAELRCIVRMIVDPRYRMTWTGKIMPIVFIFGLILCWWVISDIPIVGGFLDRICSLVLTYFLVKVLGREATRYRQTSPDLPPGLRL